MTYAFAIGGSMLPTLGRFNFIKITKQGSYKIGDIISLKTNDGLFHCHRIIELTENFVTTKGDNKPIQDYEKLVSIKNIEGIVKQIWGI
jgi:signal peptidase I